MQVSTYEDLTFVVQGPIIHDDEGNVTLRCIDSIRKWYPSSSIVLSTWTDPGQLEHVDVLVNEDPGPIQTQDVFYKNYNRMMKSTAAGMAIVKTRYAAKIRSDFWFRHFYPILEVYRNEGTITEKWCHLLKGRIMMCMQEAHYRLHPYYPSDWFNCGHTEDMRKLWHGLLVPPVYSAQIPNFWGRLLYSSLGCGNQFASMDHPLHSEQQLCIDFLRNLGLQITYSNVRQSTLRDLLAGYRLLGELFMVIPRYELGLISSKHATPKCEKDLYVWDLAVNQNSDPYGIRLLIAVLGPYLAAEAEEKRKSLICALRKWLGRLK